MKRVISVLAALGFVAILAACLGYGHKEETPSKVIVPNTTVAQATANIADAYRKVNAGFQCDCGGVMYGIPYPNSDKLQRHLWLDQEHLKWYDVYALKCRSCGKIGEYKHPCPHLDIKRKP